MRSQNILSKLAAELPTTIYPKEYLKNNTYGEGLPTELGKQESYLAKNPKIRTKLNPNLDDPINVQYNTRPGNGFSRENRTAYIDQNPETVADKRARDPRISERAVQQSAASNDLSLYGSSYDSASRAYDENNANIPGALEHEVTHGMYPMSNDVARHDMFQSMGPLPYNSYSQLMDIEKVPNLAAVQRHLYKTTGSRVETPAGYGDYVNQFDTNLSGPEYEDKIKGLPKGARRLLIARKNIADRNAYSKWVLNNPGMASQNTNFSRIRNPSLRERNFKGTEPFLADFWNMEPNSLESFDKENSEMMPGIVRNNPTYRGAPQRSQRAQRLTA